jgi:hypothetical protein
MDKQNITLSLPKDLLRKAKQLALDRQLSLSGLMVQLLHDVVRHEEEYEQARLRSIERMRQGYALGTNGVISWSREELYDR